MLGGLFAVGVAASISEASTCSDASCAASQAASLLQMKASETTKLKDESLLQVAARSNKTAEAKYAPEDEDGDRRRSEPREDTRGRSQEYRGEQDHPITRPEGRLAQSFSETSAQTQSSEECSMCDNPDKASLLQKKDGDDPCERCRKMSRNLVGARIAPFGKEDTARELQHHAARTQDTLVDAIENAEVAEIKRSIFRSLTRLRAAEIKEFDTIARLETQAIDEYNDNHHYRAENPLDYIHAAEGHVKEDKYTSFHD